MTEVKSDIGNTAELYELGHHVAEALEDSVLSVEVAARELTVEVKREAVVEVLTFLRDDQECLFKSLIDICGVDYPEREERFDVVYHLLSLHHNQRIRVRVKTDDVSPVPSANDVYAAAGWFERECWDMYGVMFSGHPDLRRILTDYGFSGFPLRKDFPLTGHVEVRYSEDEKRVVYEPVKLTQDFRSFDFMSPWEGAKYILSDGGDDDGAEEGA